MTSNQLRVSPTASLWRQADFLRLLIGTTVSLCGSALTAMAVPFLAAVALQATPAEMGLLGVAGSAPVLLVSLFAGVWIDRYSRRTCLIVGDLGRALLLLTIPVAALFGILSIVQLYLVEFLSGILTVFFDIAWRSYLPSVVGPGHLVEANGKLELSNAITGVARLSLAGIVIQLLTAAFAIAIDALTFLVSALCILGISRCEELPRPAAAPVLAQIRDGMRLVLQSPWLRAFAGCMATSNFSSNIFFALYMLFGTRELGMSAAELGVVYGIGASGALAGAALAPWAAARFGLGPAIAGAAFIGSIEVIPAVFATPDSAVPLLLVSSFLGNLGWDLYRVNELSVRQAITPPALLGRMNATLSFVVAGMLPLGALVGGALGEVLGVRAAISVAACASALSVLWILLSPVRGMRHLPVQPAA